MSGAPPRIRPFAAGDAEAVAALAAALNAEEGYSRGTTPDAEALRNAFLGPQATGCLLAAADGAHRPIGYVTVHATYETEFAERGAYLGDLYVARDMRRQGVGRALVAAAAALVQTQGGAFLWWTALPRNIAAHAFYRALGAEGEPIQVFALTRDAFARLAAP